MYTKRELRAASRIIRKVARTHNVSEAQARIEMQEAIEEARNNPDPAAQANWKGFRCAGEKPTVEEFLLWAASRLKGL